MNTEIIDNPSVMLQNVAAHIPADKYIAEYRDSERFMGYCRQCRRYGKPMPALRSTSMLTTISQAIGTYI